MLFMVVLATIVLPNFPALSASQLDNANLPLTYPARVINTEQVCPPNKVQVSEQNEVAQDIQDLLDIPCAKYSKPSPALLPPAVCFPPAVPLATTGSGAPMGLQCRSTVIWTECVAAITLEDGHVLPTLT